MGVLLLPGAAALHPHVLLLLRCLFDVPDLQLGPAGVSLVLDSNFLSPLVSLSQVRTLPEPSHSLVMMSWMNVLPGGHAREPLSAFDTLLAG